MDDMFFITMPENPMAAAVWWYSLSDQQKKQHLFIDSELTLNQIKLLLRIYGEESLIEKENTEAS